MSPTLIRRRLLILICATLTCLWLAGCKKPSQKRSDNEKTPTKNPTLKLVKLPLQSTHPLQQNMFEIQLFVGQSGVHLALKSPVNDKTLAAKLPEKMRDHLVISREGFDKLRKKQNIDGPQLKLSSDLTILPADKQAGNARSFMVQRLRKPLERLVEWSRGAAILLKVPWTPAATLHLEANVPYRTIVDLIYTLSRSKISDVQFAVDGDSTLRSLRVNPPKYLPMRVEPGKPAPVTIAISVAVTRDGLRFDAWKQRRGRMIRKKLSKPGTEKNKKTTEKPAEEPWKLSLKIPPTASKRDDLLKLYQQIVACRKRNPRIKLTVSAGLKQKWDRIARVLAVATVVRQGVGFKSVDQLLKAPPVKGKKARIPVVLSLTE